MSPARGLRIEAVYYIIMSNDKRRILNKAVRESLPGGSLTLDSLELFNRITLRHDEHTEPGKIARLAEDRLKQIANEMRDHVLAEQKNAGR